MSSLVKKGFIRHVLFAEFEPEVQEAREESTLGAPPTAREIIKPSPLRTHPFLRQLCRPGGLLNEGHYNVSTFPKNTGS